VTTIGSGETVLAEVGADKRRSINDWARYYAQEDKTRAQRQKANERAAAATAREAAAVERRVAQAEALAQRQGNAQARTYNRLQLGGRLLAAPNDQSRAEILRAEAEQYGGEGTVEGLRLLNRASRYQGAYNRYALRVFSRGGDGDGGGGGPGGPGDPPSGSGRHAGVSLGGARLFGLRGLAGLTSAGFVLREGLRVSDAYLDRQRDTGLSGNNQDEILAAELRFHDSLEGIPVAGEIKRRRDFDARTSILALSRSTTADATRADQLYETRLSLQSRGRIVAAAEVGENDDFEGRRATTEAHYTDKETAARAERDLQAKLDQDALNARRGNLYATFKEGMAQKGLAGRLASYVLDDTVQQATSGALAQQSSQMGFARQRNYQSAVDLADRARLLELREIDRQETPVLFRSSARVRSNLFRSSRDPLAAELTEAMGETAAAVSERSGPAAKQRVFAENTTAMVSVVASSVRDGLRRGLASSGELSVTRAMLRHDPLGARLADIESRRQQELFDMPTGVSGWLLDLVGGGAASVNARADAQKRLAIDQNTFDRRQASIGLEGERQQLLSQLNRDPVAAEAAGISASGRMRAADLLQRGMKPEAMQALNNAMLSEDVLKKDYLNSFRAEQVDLSQTFVGNRRDAEDPAAVVKAITDFKNELGQMIKNALSDAVSN
jgi:hypothetical protein